MPQATEMGIPSLKQLFITMLITLLIPPPPKFFSFKQLTPSTLNPTEQLFFSQAWANYIPLTTNSFSL